MFGSLIPWWEITSVWINRWLLLPSRQNVSGIASLTCCLRHWQACAIETCLSGVGNVAAPLTSCSGCNRTRGKHWLACINFTHWLFPTLLTEMTHLPRDLEGHMHHVAAVQSIQYIMILFHIKIPPHCDDFNHLKFPTAGFHGNVHVLGSNYLHCLHWLILHTFFFYRWLYLQ